MYGGAEPLGQPPLFDVSAYPAITAIETDKQRLCKYIACSDNLDDSDFGDLFRSIIGESVDNHKITATEMTVKGGRGAHAIQE